jgi:hypothetical protein
VISGIKSAELKLARASKHLRAIKRCIAIYSARKPHKVTRKAKGKRKLNIPKSPPQEISILAGEMIYQMRSALDHLAFEIVKLNPNISTIDAGWREHCQFPLRTRIPKGCTLPVTKDKFSGDLPGVTDEIFAVIESMQPYYGKDAQPFYKMNAVNNCLRFLCHLSNIDKHRHLNVIRARVRQSRHIKYRSGVESGGWQIFDRGATIEGPGRGNESDKLAYVNIRYRTLVSFDEREHLGDATDVPIDILLTMILYYIEVFVVPALHKLIKEP